MFGRSAHSAVKKYAMGILSKIPYPYSQYSLIYEGVTVSIIRRVIIVKGKCKGGETLQVTIVHPKLEAPIVKPVLVGNALFIDSHYKHIVAINYDFTIVVRDMSWLNHVYKSIELVL
jgi:hypothetical protein